MADLVPGGGEVGEEERAVLEKSGVLPSRKLKGKAKARSANGPKHVVFVEEGEEGSSVLCHVCTEVHPDRVFRHLSGAFEPGSGPRNSV